MDDSRKDMVIRSLTGNFSEKILSDVVPKIREMDPDEVVSSVKVGGGRIVISQDAKLIASVMVVIEYSGRKYFVGV